MPAGKNLRDHLAVSHDEGVTVGVVAAISANFASGIFDSAIELVLDTGVVINAHHLQRLQT